MATPGAHFRNLLDPPELPVVAGERLPAWLWIATHFQVKDATDGRPVPFVVFPWMARALIDTMPAGAELPFGLLVWSTVKKSGKTAFNAGVGTNLMFNRAPPGSEFYNFANSKDQAAGRVFQAIRYAVRRNPLLLEQCSDVLLTMIRLKNDTVLSAMAAKDATIAGANPYYSGWTELWGFEFEDDLRAWEEMTPPPTIRDSIRVVDTYAGYEGESGLLNGIEDAAKASTRWYADGFELPSEYREYARGVIATKPELEQVLLPTGSGRTGPVGFTYPLPVYVDTVARNYVFWDDGERARRMPWQQGAAGRRYYAQEERNNTPSQYGRLHLNRRAKRGGQYVSATEWELLRDTLRWQPGDPDAIYLSVDAATHDDHMALVGVRLRDRLVQQCLLATWVPTPDARMDGKAIIDPQWAGDEILRLRNNGMNIKSLAYDPYQFHSVALGLAAAGITIFEVTQGQPRLEADTLLRTLIRDGGIEHTHDVALQAAVENANAMEEKGKSGDERKVRIVKGSGKVDPLVALSMAVWSALHEMPVAPTAAAPVQKTAPQTSISGHRELGAGHADRRPRDIGHRRTGRLR